MIEDQNKGIFFTAYLPAKIVITIVFIAIIVLFGNAILLQLFGTGIKSIHFIEGALITFILLSCYSLYQLISIYKTSITIFEDRIQCITIFQKKEIKFGDVAGFRMNTYLLGRGVNRYLTIRLRGSGEKIRIPLRNMNHSLLKRLLKAKCIDLNGSEYRREMAAAVNDTKIEKAKKRYP